MSQIDTKFNTDTQRLFSRWAVMYDSPLFRIYFERLYQRIVRILDDEANKYLTPHATMLDVACGTGEIIFRLAKKYPAVNFTGIDLTPAMVTAAQDKAKALPNITVKAGNASNLPFIDQTFDIVLCSEAFHHFSNPEQALREINRVARHHSLFLLVDPGAASKIVTKAMQIIARTFEVNKQLYNQDELRELLTGNGFGVRSQSHHFFNNFFVCEKN